MTAKTETIRPKRETITSARETWRAARRASEERNRSTGRTLAMVRALPETGAVVITHSAEHRRYVERMVRDVRGAETAKLVSVRVVRGWSDVQTLEGLRVPVRVDHAVGPALNAVTWRALKCLIEGVNLMFPGIAGRA